MSSFEPRIESDVLGERAIAAGVLYGIHTIRAVDNFPISQRLVDFELIRAYGAVKLACIRTNRKLGLGPEPRKAEAIEQACYELSQGQLQNSFPVDALQGGAGTSTNMNVNEVIANRALQILGLPLGGYSEISPLEDVNLQQSTNDTYPSALKLAAIRRIRQLEAAIVALQEAFQRKEREFADVVKVGRTELQDAVLITLGLEMSCYAEALARDRWRIYKSEERLRVINLGGTAVGTGLGAAREYIFSVVEQLRDITGIAFARAENMVDATQNCDVFVEVSGMLKALAVTLLKCSNDLRLMSSGPEAGLGEITLPPLQAGSSIMPGKVNPVIPEAVGQAALLVMGYDQVIAMASGLGAFELNQYLPLIAYALLESINLLTQSSKVLAERCVNGLQANRERCSAQVCSSTAVATALVQELGYEKVSECFKAARVNQRSFKEEVLSSTGLSPERFEWLISAEAVLRLGSREK